MERKYLQLNDIDCYKRALKLSYYIWDIVVAWDSFPKNSIGIQFMRAADSISANIAEGFGRYGKGDKIRFYYFSLGSVKECLDWNEKSKHRTLASEIEYRFILKELQLLPKELHQLIKFTSIKLKE